LDIKTDRELGRVMGEVDGPTLLPGVTVIWVSPRFGHPHSPNPGDMGIPFSYYLSDFGLGLQGMPLSTGFWE